MKKIMFNDYYGLTQAVLEGRKTQTRRLMLLPNNKELRYVRDKNTQGIIEVWLNDGMTYELPRYHVGEEVAVAQPYKNIESVLTVPISDNEFEQRQAYHIYGDMAGWNNKMFVRSNLMPHRIRITNVRVEHLQDISDEDCLREGVIAYDDIIFGKGYMLDEEYNNNYRRHCFTTARKAFSSLIDKVSGKGTWDRNPWVFVYNFELIK